MIVSAIEGHKLWAPIYDSGQNPLIVLETRVVTRMLQGIKFRRVLDLACGTGRWMLYFQRRGSMVTGIDACDEMLIQAKRHNMIRNSIIVGDALQIPLVNAAADLVICSFAASYIRDLRQLMSEIRRVAACNAVVVLSDMHRSAIKAGWRRSFKIDDSVYELQSYDYSADELLDTAAVEGLHLQRETHAFFEDEERPIFEQAGKLDLYAAARTIPAVWAASWTVVCC